MKKIRVVHFGIAHDHSAPIMECVRNHPDVFDIVGICEPDEGMRARYGGHRIYEGIPWISEEELLTRQDIDAVFCEGHEFRSVSDAQKCIDRGLHVHLDKPGGKDLAAFEHLLRSAEEKNLTLHMGYMYRWNPAFKYALKKVRSGELGQITGIDGSFSILHPAEKRQWMKQFPGGMMFFLGCHVIDMIMLLNGVPTNVVAFNRESGDDNGGALDSSLAVLDYPNGACTVRANATETNGFIRRHLHIVGTKGTIDIEPLESPTLMRVAMKDNVGNLNTHDTSNGIFPGFLPGRYDEMMLEFASCVRGEMKNPVSADYELELQRVVLEACR